MNRIHYFTLFYMVLFWMSCKNSTTSTSTLPNIPSAAQADIKAPLFEALPAEKTGIGFNNELDINILKSPLEYINVYNGGGVATGDINNDGLPDLYFTGNLVSNKLYLNKGNLQFEDITEKAGVATSQSWSTGVTMADVNRDGFLDIYVCRAYYDDSATRENLLFINNGDLTFTEQAEKYGLNDSGYSITATFFDYDKDGWADLYVANHPLNRNYSAGKFISLGEHILNWKNPPEASSSKLYHNDGNGHFTDVTRKAGLIGYSWGLGVVSADLNQDGWTDLYLAVDHTEPDRYYLNKGDGTFQEVSDQKLKHMSHSSMGIDAADINNDCLLDLMIVEMLATNNFSEKTKMAAMNPKSFWGFVDAGYQYQYMRNMLQLNVGNGEFSEIGQMAGVHRTNWSWTSLLADFNNDGWKDLYVTNGYLHEYLDKDHMSKYIKSIQETGQSGATQAGLIADFGKKAPTNKVENNFFINNGDLTFTEKGKESGLNFLGFSSGAVYIDLDKDGDLDLVVNNSNDPASVYKNLDRDNGGSNYLSIRLAHEAYKCPVGTKVTIETSGGKQFQEFTYTRGYQSSGDGTMHFGIGQNEKVNTLTVEWLNGKQQYLTNLSANQEITLKYTDAGAPKKKEHPLPLFSEITDASGIDFAHKEIPFDDYKKQVLLPHKMSQFGPFLSTADVNEDGLEDFFVGGAKGQPGALYVQKSNGHFEKADIPSFLQDLQYEDMGSAFFDANNDGRIDLYVASGSNEDVAESELLKDRLYINVGKGVLRKVTNALPDIRISSSCVKPFDFDKDGDMDLFVGGRQQPGRYPTPASSVLLENTKGMFRDVTAQKAPVLQDLGMVTDALWTDFNNDGTADLLITGEWMPLTVIKQVAGKFTNATEEVNLQSTVGWWNRIAQGDIDNDGDQDYIAGNLGWNYKYRATAAKPFHIYGADFDDNGSFDIALGYFLESDVLYPVRGRQCSSEQCPQIAQKFKSYEDFGKASIAEVYGDKLKDALHYVATDFTSSVLLNMGNGKFELIALPNEAQIAPINAMVIEDFDLDGFKDVLVGGNLYVSEVETGRADAGRGLFLKGLGNGNFLPVPFDQSGLHLTGDVKDIVPIKGQPGSEIHLLVGNNDSKLQFVKYIGPNTKELN